MTSSIMVQSVVAVELDEAVAANSNDDDGVSMECNDVMMDYFKMKQPQQPKKARSMNSRKRSPSTASILVLLSTILYHSFAATAINLSRQQADSVEKKLFEVMNDTKTEQQELFETYNRLFDGEQIEPTNETATPTRRILFDESIVSRSAIDKLRETMKNEFNADSRSDSIHYWILSNQTTILVLKTANRYYYWTYAQTASAMVIFCMIVVGNLSILHRLESCRRRRSNVNYFIAQLAIADLLVGIFSVTLDSILRLHKDFPYGIVACRASKYIAVLFIYSSTNLLVALSIDRWEAVVKPLAFTRNRSRGHHLVAGAWILAFIFALPVTFFTVTKDVDGVTQCWIEMGNHGWRYYMIYLTCLLLILPAVIIAICYTHIVYTIWSKARFVVDVEERHHRATNSADHHDSVSTTTTTAITIKHRRPIKTQRQLTTTSDGQVATVDGFPVKPDTTNKISNIDLKCARAKSILKPGHDSNKETGASCVTAISNKNNDDENGIIDLESVNANGSERRQVTTNATNDDDELKTTNAALSGDRQVEVVVLEADNNNNLMETTTNGDEDILSSLSLSSSIESLSSSSSLAANVELEATAFNEGDDGGAAEKKKQQDHRLTVCPAAATATAAETTTTAVLCEAVDMNDDKSSTTPQQQQQNSVAASAAAAAAVVLLEFSQKSFNEKTNTNEQETDRRLSNGKQLNNNDNNRINHNNNNFRSTSPANRQTTRAPSSSALETIAQRRERDRHQESSGVTQQHGSGVIPKARIKTIKMTLVIVVAYILCWSPFLILNLLNVFGYMAEDTTIKVSMMTLSQSLAHINSAVNPIIFWLFSSRKNQSATSRGGQNGKARAHQKRSSDRRQLASSTSRNHQQSSTTKTSIKLNFDELASSSSRKQQHEQRQETNESSRVGRDFLDKLFWFRFNSSGE